jgi:hypothetical protein
MRHKGPERIDWIKRRGPWRKGEWIWHQRETHVPILGMLKADSDLVQSVQQHDRGKIHGIL